MTITAEEKNTYIDMLDVLTWQLEKEISNYALESHEDLLDEGYMSRAQVGRGTKPIMVSPWAVQWVEQKTPSNLWSSLQHQPGDRLPCGRV